MENPKKTVVHLPSPLFVSSPIGWFEAGVKGRGIVALEDIPAGVVLERGPVIPVPNDILRTADGEESALESYMFRWGPEDENGMPTQCCWVLGNIPLVNHAHAPNCDVRNDLANKVMELFTLRAVARGEEITIDYDLGDDIWFDYKE